MALSCVVGKSILEEGNLFIARVVWQLPSHLPYDLADTKPIVQVRAERADDAEQASIEERQAHSLWEQGEEGGYDAERSAYPERVAERDVLAADRAPTAMRAWEFTVEPIYEHPVLEPPALVYSITARARAGLWTLHVRSGIDTEEGLEASAFPLLEDEELVVEQPIVVLPTHSYMNFARDVGAENFQPSAGLEKKQLRPFVFRLLQEQLLELEPVYYQNCVEVRWQRDEQVVPMAPVRWGLESVLEQVRYLGLLGAERLWFEVLISKAMRIRAVVFLTARGFELAQSELENVATERRRSNRDRILEQSETTVRIRRPGQVDVVLRAPLGGEELIAAEQADVRFDDDELTEEEEGLSFPHVVTLRIPNEKMIRLLNMPRGGLGIISQQAGVKVDVDQYYTVSISSRNDEAIQEVIRLIKKLVDTPAPAIRHSEKPKDASSPELNENYLGTVKRIVDFGAFVEIMPGTVGLLHISEVADYRVEDVVEELSEGDQILVKVTQIGKIGRIRLSRRAVLREQAGLPPIPLPRRDPE